MLRKNWVFWLNSTLLHGIVIVLLWFPQPLHFPTRADVMNALLFDKANPNLHDNVS